MKTTLELDDALDDQVRATARKRGWSLKDTISKALRAGLQTLHKDAGTPPLFRWHTSPGRLLVDPADREALSKIFEPEP